MENYDPKDVVVNVDSTVITGFASGSFVTVEKSEDNFTEYVGAQGEVAVAEKSNNTGKITLKVKNTSPSYLFLESLAKEKRFYPANVVDRNTGKTYGGTECRIRKSAKAEFSNEITEREFELFVSDYQSE